MKHGPIQTVVFLAGLHAVQVHAELILNAGSSSASEIETGSNFCKFPALNFHDAPVLDRQVQVRPGSTCVFKTNLAGVGNNVEFPVQPKKGRLGKVSQFNIAYRPTAQGGQDYFEILQHYEDLSGKKYQVLIKNYVVIDANLR